jgi:hypothetical protein
MRRALLSALVMAGVAIPSAVQALCLSTDIFGGWFTFTNGGPVVNRCSLQFDFLGRILSNSWCWDADLIRRGGLSGQFFVHIGCKVTGTMSSPHIGFNVIEGSLTHSKEIGAGIGLNDLTAFSFTMIRG